MAVKAPKRAAANGLMELTEMQWARVRLWASSKSLDELDRDTELSSRLYCVAFGGDPDRPCKKSRVTNNVVNYARKHARRTICTEL